MSGWPWPLDGIQSWFDNLWNWISQAAVNAVSVVSNWIWSAVYWLRDRVSEVGSWIWSRISPVLGPVADWIRRAASWAWDSLWAFAKDPLGFIKRGTDWLGSMLTQAWNSIVAGVNALGSSVSSWLGAARDYLAGKLTGVYNSLVGAVGGAVNTLGAAFNGAVATVGGWVSAALSGVAKALGEGLQGFLDWFLKGIGTVATTVGSFLNERVVAPLASAVGGLKTWLTNALQGLFTSVLNFFASPKSPDPQDPVRSIAEALTTVFGFGLSMALPVMAGELVHPVKQMGFPQLSAMLYDMSGFGRIASALTLELATASYITPLRWGLNTLWRPRIPPTAMADRMLLEGHIGEGDWRTIYAKWGWKEGDIDAWRRSMYTKPNQRTLLTMLEDPEVPEDWIIRKLTELGLERPDVDQLVGYKRRLIEAKRLARFDSEKSKLVTNAKYDFARGYITEEDLRSTLKSLDYTSEEVEYHVRDAREDRERKRKDMLVDNYVEAYVKGMIESDQELRDRLAEIMVDPQLVEVTVDDAYVRRFKKPRGS